MYAKYLVHSVQGSPSEQSLSLDLNIKKSFYDFNKKRKNAINKHKSNINFINVTRFGTIWIIYKT